MNTQKNTVIHSNLIQADFSIFYIEAEKGKNVMAAFDNSEFEKYKSEVQKRWGKTDAYKEHAEKTKNYGKDKWSSLASDMNDIFGEFAVCMKNGDAPESEHAQDLVKKLQDHITANYYHCTKEIVFGLGQMYVADERFKYNIDKHGDGTAAFARDAIAHYSKR